MADFTPAPETARGWCQAVASNPAAAWSGSPAAEPGFSPGGKPSAGQRAGGDLENPYRFANWNAPPPGPCLLATEDGVCKPCAHLGRTGCARKCPAGAKCRSVCQSEDADGLHLPTDGLDVSFDAATATVTLAGSVDDQATKEKILLCCGNVAVVAGVNDLLVGNTPAPEAQYHAVVSGDNLSKIAKAFYGDANKYPLIFEANKPMLSHPDKIYAGQLLRVPPLG